MVCYIYIYIYRDIDIYLSGIDDLVLGYAGYIQAVFLNFKYQDF